MLGNLCELNRGLSLQRCSIFGSLRCLLSRLPRIQHLLKPRFLFSWSFQLDIGDTIGNTSINSKLLPAIICGHAIGNRSQIRLWNQTSFDLSTICLKCFSSIQLQSRNWPRLFGQGKQAETSWNLGVCIVAAVAGREEKLCNQNHSASS